MSTRVTNEGTDVDVPLEGGVSLLSPRAGHPGLHKDAAFRSKRRTSPGAPAMRFERKVRRALNQRFLEVFTTLSARLHSKNEQLYDHSQRVLSLALCLLRVLDLSEEEVLTIALAAFFHDIGKIGIDNVILEKPLPLTYAEYELMKKHPAYGARILCIYRPMNKVVPLVYHHHERWDGGGYPDGLEGEAIPLGARIIAIADAFDAMTSNRDYQAQRTSIQACEELYRCAGTQFDPRLVKLFCAGNSMTEGWTQVEQSYPAGH